MNIWYIYLYMFNMFFFLASVLLHTCGCVPSQPCGSCSGCSGLCSSRSESLGSRPSDLAYVCERACSSASRNHNVPSSPLQNHSVTISFNSVCQCNTYDIANVDLDQEAYLLRCPRGRDGLSPSCLWPPPLCCCQWQRRECFPCWETEGMIILKQCLAGEGGDESLVQGGAVSGAVQMYFLLLPP